MKSKTKYFFSRSAAKARLFFKGRPSKYLDVFGPEYAYWIAQLNLATSFLYIRYLKEHCYRVLRSDARLQLLVLSDARDQQNFVNLLLCGTPSFFPAPEILRLVRDAGRLVILFNPDSKYPASAAESWQLPPDIKKETVISDVSFPKRLILIFKAVVEFRIDAFYDYRIYEFEELLRRVDNVAGTLKIRTMLTKDIVSPFDLYFLYAISAERRVWKNIADASLEHEYLKLLNRKTFPVEEVHFFSDHHKQQVLEIGYLWSQSILRKAMVVKEPYFEEIFAAKIGEKQLTMGKKAFLVIGIWNHGGHNALRKTVRFARLLLRIAASKRLARDFSIVYKPHPRKKHNALFLRLLKRLGMTITDASGNVVDVIPGADVILSLGSISTVHGINLGKRVIYPKDKYLNFWVEYEKDIFERNGLVDVAETFADIERLATEPLSDSVKHARKQHMWAAFGLSVRPESA